MGLNDVMHRLGERVRRGLYLSIFLFFLVISTGGLERVGVYLYNGQINAITLSSLLLLVLLYVPVTPGKGRSPLWRALDFLLIAATLAFTVYYVYSFDRFIVRFGTAQGVQELVLGALVMVVIFETTRRTMGLPLVVLLLLFTAYPFVANLAPGILRTNQSNPYEFVGQIWLSDNGIFGTLATILPEYIFPFLLFASAISLSGAGEFFKDLSLSLAGKTTGGTAKAAVLANFFIGMISGSSVADVSTTGPLFIPLMKKTRYKGEYAGGVIAAASTAAQLSPPVMGAAAFIMAQILGVPYGDIALAAIIPSILFYLALLMIVHLDSAKGNMGMLSAELVPGIRQVMAQGWHHLVPVIILVGLLVGRQPPRYAALAAVIAIIIISLLKRDGIMGFRNMHRMAHETVASMVPMGPMVGAAGTIVGVVSLTALAFKLSTDLVTMAGGNLYLVLIFGAIACLILGMGLPTIPAYIVVSVILVQPLAHLGVAPLVSHMFVFYFALASMLTPPVAISVYVVMPMTGTGLWSTGYMATRLGIATFIVPFLFVAENDLLFAKHPLDTLVALVAAVLTTLSLATGLAGYLSRNVHWLWRVILVAAVLPSVTALPLSIKLLGGVPFLALLFWQLVLARGPANAEVALGSG